MSKYPLKFSVTRPGQEVFDGYDRFGNEVWITLPEQDISVFSYAVVRTEEGLTEGQMRMVERLEVIAPSGSLTGADTVTVAGEDWNRDGAPQSYGNNPYFDPGLETYFYKRTTAV